MNSKPQTLQEKMTKIKVEKKKAAEKAAAEAAEAEPTAPSAIQGLGFRV